MGIRESLLTLLTREPAYGYQLKQDFEERTGRAWLLNIGQVYTTLQRLERDGVIESEGEDADGRRRYRITEAGRDEMRRWFATPVVSEGPRRDELAMKVLMALGADDLDVEQIIQAQRKATVETLQQYTRTKATADPAADLAWLLVVDAMIMHAEAEIRWLDLCEARIRRARHTGERRDAVRLPTDEEVAVDVEEVAP